MSWIAAAAGIGPLAYVLGVIWPRGVRGEGLPSIDFHAYHGPVIAYTQRAWSQGHGLLWDDLQNAGQPFIGMPQTAGFYPLTHPLSLLEPVQAQLVWIVIHLAIAGIGAFLLARTMGLGRPQALVTLGVAQFGGLLPFMGLWSATVFASFAWLPMALFTGERLFRNPTLVRAQAVGLVLTAQVLSGFPQIVVFTYLLLGLRFLFAVPRAAWRANPRAWLSCLVAVVLPLLLGAIYFLPSLEVAGESVRSLPMTKATLNMASQWDPIARVGVRVSLRSSMGGLFPAVVALAFASIGRVGSRREVTFYLLAASAFLALVPPWPLRDFYQTLPIFDTLRGPDRFAWMTSLCLTLLAGHGVDALARPASKSAGALAIGGACFGLLAFHVLVGGGARAGEVVIVGAMGVVGIAAILWPRVRTYSPPALVALLVIALWPAVSQPALRLYLDDTETHAARSAFGFVAGRQTPQDRVFVQPKDRWKPVSIAVVDKAPSFYGLPSVTGYQHLTSRPYADIAVYMTTERFLGNAGQFTGSVWRAPRNAPLFNLLGARHIVTDRKRVSLPVHARKVFEGDGYRVFENAAALPRAFVVPRAEVIASPRDRIRRLASKAHDPRRLVILDELPPQGWLGGDAPASPGRASVHFRRAYGEHLVLDVTSPNEGFLVLSDQHFPGWEVSVDDQPATLLKANHAFRAVRIPAGTSTVEFRYVPGSMMLGAAISAVTACGLIGAGLRQRWISRGS